MNRLLVKVFITALQSMIVLNLAGCGDDDMKELEGFIQQVKSTPAGEVEKIPDVVVYKPHNYQGGALRDPFTLTETMKEKLGLEKEDQTSQVIRSETPQIIKPDPNRIKEPLEAYSLDNVRMVGTVEYQGALWALLKSKNGAVNRVTIGNHLGQNHGRITLVDKNHIDILEIIPDGLGGWIMRQTSIALQKQATPDRI